MRRTRLADGSPFVFHLGDMSGFTTHDWELGLGGGDYGGANLISVYGAYSLTDNMKVELTGAQFLGNASTGWKAELGLTHVIVPEWRLSPFLRARHGHRVHRTTRDDRAPRRPYRPDGVCGRGAAFLSHPAFLRSRRLSLAHGIHEPR